MVKSSISCLCLHILGVDYKNEFHYMFHYLNILFVTTLYIITFIAIIIPFGKGLSYSRPFDVIYARPFLVLY